ncbi:MAG: hypothetical protein P8M20_13185 [Planctomycetaceae bacterium]|nr:hypothetical protein [Planctomycetaceae bacterium]
MPRFSCSLAAAILFSIAANFSAAELSPQLKAVRSVSREGQGNEAAAAAVRTLSAASASDLLQILIGFEGASPLAANYLRNAVESVVDRHLAANKPLPAKQLEAFVLKRSNDPRARRLAFEVLAKVDLTASDRLIPKMLLDPSPEFRRDAVQRLVGEAEGLGKDSADKAKQVYRKALSGATDSDLVKKISKSLKDLGDEVDLVTHFGFLTDWRIVGPFDNRGFIGFDIAYAPEKELDFVAKLQAKDGEVAWGVITTSDEFGIVDIAKSVAPHKGAVMYLATSYESAANRNVEFRFGTPNAWKLWVNGKFLFGRDEYHRGMAIDQYRVPANLKAGKNVILLKLCQNEQDDDWAQRYQIQIRVCDPSGVAVLPVKSGSRSTTGMSPSKRQSKRLTASVEGASQ